MKVGHLIRTERVQQEMKQVVLAKGIYPLLTYLNRKKFNCPSEEIVTLLFNRLGIDIDKLQTNDQSTEISFEKLLKDVYKKVITTRDDHFTRQKLAELEKQSTLFENDSLYYILFISCT